MIFGLLYLLSLIVSIVLLILLTKTSKIDISKRLFTLGVLVSFWLLMETSSYIVPASWVLVMQKMKYFGVILVAPTLLLSTVIFIKKYPRVNLLVRISLYIVPVLSLLSVLTGIFPYPFLDEARVQYQDEIPIYLYHKNIGFIIHTAYSYILILTTCYLLFIRALRSPKLYRRQSMFVFLGCTLSFVLNVLFITQAVLPLSIDTTPISVLLTLLVFYWGVFHLPKSIIVPYARDLVIENIKDLILIVDNYSCIIDANPAAIRLIACYADSELGQSLTLNKLIGVNINDLYHHIPQLKERIESHRKKEESVLLFNTNSKNSYYKIVAEDIYDSDQNIIGKLYLLQDITEIKEQMNNLIQLNEELIISDKIIKDALEGIIITDHNNMIIKANDSMAKMSGYSKEELIGQNPRIMKSDYHDTSFYMEMWEQIISTGSWEGEIWDKNKSGDIYPKWMSITTIFGTDRSIINYIGISSDISKMKKAEKDIQLLAYYDSLTGVPNRTLFYDRLKTALNRAKINNISVALFFMDLDRFKIINDSLGHDAGDLVLIEVTKRIKDTIREGDTLYRLGGDEFTLIIEDSKSAEEAINIAENIVQQFSRPFHIMGREVSIGISIGIAVAPYDDSTLEGIIRKADSAMYHAKETGRGKYVFSSVEIEQRSQGLLEMQLRLKEALQLEEFRLYLQPQMAYRDGSYQTIGAEALIRWNCKGTNIPPDKFIPAAEENNLILPISRWIIGEIFRIDRELKAHNIDIQLAINVSVKQFENLELIELLKKMLKENSMQQIRLVIEITESMFIHDLQRAVEYLQEIKKLGVSIAIDDFGTGYSSLSYLTRLPMDYVKVDKSFVSKLDEVQNRNLTFSIITMAKTLGLKTLAEGVETEEQATLLTAKSCDELQGFYFSRPLPVEEFIRWYQRL